MASSSLWQRFQRYFLYYRDLDFSLDISRMKFPEDFFEKMQPKIGKAFAAMRELEAGAIANLTEKRMVVITGSGVLRLRQPRKLDRKLNGPLTELKNSLRMFMPEKSRPKIENASSMCC